MNEHAKRIGTPAQPIRAGGETYEPNEIRAILQELARLGINQDKIIAQITPKEAAILKSLGGSGEINPRTGLLSFDDGGGGGDGGGGDGGGGDGGGGEGGGGEGGGGDAGGDAGGGDAGGEAGGEAGSGDDGGAGSASAGEGAGADEGGGGWGGYGGGWGGYGDMGDDAGYSGPAGDAMGEAAGNYGGFSGYGADAMGGDPAGDPAGDPGDPDAPSSDSYAMSGPLTDAVMGQITGFSPSQAQAIADVIQDAANQGVNIGLYDAAVMAGVMGQGPTQGSSPDFGTLDMTAFNAPTNNATSSYGVTGQNVGELGLTGRGDFSVAGIQGSSPSYGTMSMAGLSDPAATAAAVASNTASQSSGFPAGDIAGTTGNMNMGSSPTASNPTSDVVASPDLPALSVTEVPNAPNVFDAYAQTNNDTQVAGDFTPSGAGGGNGIRPLGSDFIPATDVIQNVSLESGLTPDQEREIIATALARSRNRLLGSYAYANGGLVDPTQPTMAYTDGAGTPGYYSQQPALTSWQEFGSDVPHLSPLAPAPAAAAPSLGAMAPLSMYINKNATPAAAPVPQNPNVAASIGPGPLSRLG